MATEPTLVDEDFMVALRAHVDGLAKVYQAKLAKGDAERVEEPLSAELKQWMQLNRERLDRDAKGRACIVDGERKLTAYLASRKSTEWDVQHMPQTVIDWLLNHGLLTVNTAAFRALRKTVTAREYDQAAGYQLDGETDALYVEPVK